MNQAVGEYIRVLRRRWRLVAVVALLVLGAAAGYLLVRPPSYRATSMVLVETPGDNADSYYEGGRYAQSRIPTYVALLRDPALDSRVSEAVGQPVDPAGTTATPVPETVAVRLDTVADNPADARRINQAFLDRWSGAVAEMETIPGARYPRARLRVTQPPAADGRQAGLSAGLLLGAAGAAGLILGAGLAMLRAVTDRRIRTARDAASAAGAPVLGVLDPGADDLVERYRELRRTLVGRRGAHRPAGTIVLLTAAESGAGTTSVAAGLADCLHAVGARTIAVDLDVRTPDLGGRVDDPSPVSVVDIVVDRTAPADATAYRRADLVVLPVGGSGPETSGILDSPRVPVMLQWFRRTAEWTVLDTAPAGEYSDALRLAAHADLVLLVATLGRSKYDGIARVAAEFAGAGVSVDGIVVCGAGAAPIPAGRI